MSVAFYNRLKKLGIGPVETVVGTTVSISPEKREGVGRRARGSNRRRGRARRRAARALAQARARGRAGRGRISDSREQIEARAG
jgi:hypothetical protein